MYTSGSTGEPKGVNVVHRGVVRLVKGPNYASFETDDVFLQLAPAGFDASTLEIWGCLLNGGRLVVMKPGQPTLRELGEAIRSAGVTTLWLTASLFHLMVEEELESLAVVRQLLAGGDVLSPTHVRMVLKKCPGVTVINGYGPTENTTFTCCHPMKSVGIFGEGAVPIGQPISNTSVYLLDGAGQPVPAGVIGELYAGGDGLARGYWDRPALTADRFVPDPFSGNGYLYRTGDLARRRDDGVIEFLGRRDHQVKIRGYRVELGEIEAALRSLDGVRDAVVVARDNGPEQEKSLVAYVVGNTEPDGSTAEIRSFLEARLPAYMVPTMIRSLESLPLTATGKVDRNLLARQPISAAPPTPGVAAPLSDIAAALGDIWASAASTSPGSARATTFSSWGGTPCWPSG